MSEDGTTTPETGTGDQNTPGPDNAKPEPNGNGVKATNGPDLSAWADLAREYGDPTKVAEKLKHARTWEDRAKTNKDAADQLPTLQEQLTRLQQDLASRDERDAARTEKVALTKLEAALARHHVDFDDIDEVLRPDPKRLVKDGEPNDEVIAAFAAALAKAHGRPTADPDQGRKGGEAPQSMGDLMRAMARNR